MELSSSGWQFRLEQIIAIPVIVIVLVLNCIHPFIHTMMPMLDGGLWDNTLGYLDMLATYFSSTRS